MKDKCHGRERVACAPVDSEPNGGAFCRPLCASDAECGGGACDPARGVCVASAAPDRGFGLRCGPDSGRSDQDAGYELDGGANEQPVLMCGGLCVQLNHAPHVCSRACVFGTTAECAPASGGLRRGGCVFASEQGNIGDIGYCGELCDCNADCSDPSFVCDAFEDAKLEGAYGRKGVCTEPTLLLHAAIECAK